MTVARLLEEQLPNCWRLRDRKITRLRRIARKSRLNPSVQYLPYMPNSIVLVFDDAPIPAELQSGKLDLRLSARSEFRAVLAVLDSTGRGAGQRQSKHRSCEIPKIPTRAIGTARVSLPLGCNRKEYVEEPGEAIPAVRNPKWSEFRHGQYEIMESGFQRKLSGAPLVNRGFSSCA